MGRQNSLIGHGIVAGEENGDGQGAEPDHVDGKLAQESLKLPLQRGRGWSEQGGDRELARQLVQSIVWVTFRGKMHKYSSIHHHMHMHASRAVLVFMFLAVLAVENRGAGQTTFRWLRPSVSLFPAHATHDIAFSTLQARRITLDEEIGGGHS